MTDKRPNIVRIQAKGTDGLGVTEDLARQMCLPSGKGKCYMAVVEVMVDWVRDGREQKVAHLSIEQFWPATDDQLDEHLRNLTRTLHQNAALASEDQQLAIDTGDDLAPKVSDVLAEGAKLEPHEYVPVGDDVDQCEVCGERQAEDRHLVLDDEPEPEPDPDLEPELAEDPAEEPEPALT